MLDLVLFETRRAQLERAVASGIEAFIVDLESRGKHERQAGADTEINSDRVEFLSDLRAAGARRRFCRVNASGDWTAAEIEAALEHGATHLLLPMVRRTEEAERFVRRIDGRAGAGVLIETIDAVRSAADLDSIGLSHVYVGLNDLMIDRGSRSLFAPLADGTIERVRNALPDVAFGFGGVTTVDRGAPIPGRLLLGEMARLGCSFSFLRRSFKRDTVDRDLPTEVRRIRELWQALLRRDELERERDRAELLAAIEWPERGAGSIVPADVAATGGVDA
jgi:hypothetical protein